MPGPSLFKTSCHHVSMHMHIDRVRIVYVISGSHPPRGFLNLQRTEPRNPNKRLRVLHFNPAALYHIPMGSKYPNCGGTEKSR